jgi:hypothetical protein
MALYGCPRRTVFQTSLPVYDFLAPSLPKAPQFSRQVRRLTTTKQCFTAAASNDTQKPPPSQPSRAPKSDRDDASNPASPNKSITQAQRDFLTSAVYHPPNTSILAPRSLDLHI